MFVGLLLSVIAYPLLIIKGPLALFIFFLVLIGAFALFPLSLIDHLS